ncbi:MAG: ABC transporter permease subunit [Balneolales bacterium]|nr:ABC transporter permease subunit [Balneolales bacterium]
MVLTGISCSVFARQPVQVGSKLFTESVILGDIATLLLEAEGFEVEFYDQLGGTQILWNALIEGEIDIYPDYTGTVTQEILGGVEFTTLEALNVLLNEFEVQATRPLGFNNTYALGMNKQIAGELGIEKISDLGRHPDLVFGVSNEFMERNDGWPGLSSAYGLEAMDVTGLDHDLAYRGLEAGNIDVIDIYSTDAEIEYYDLKVLEDDLNFFPTYLAVFLYRLDVDPGVVETITKLEGQISEEEIITMNASVKLNGENDSEVAARFLEAKFGIQAEVTVQNFWSRLWETTLGHLYLVSISLGLAILIAIPLGVLAVKIPAIESPVLGFVGVMQTIPSLALLVFMIPLLGIGSIPAMAALFLYSLLPIVRNTHAGIKNIEPSLMESARALGLPNQVILQKIELPLALPTILAGVKTSAVINIGTATLGALIGAGGYGQPILTGIRLDDTSLILEGAIPAALMALLVQFLFDRIELRISRT